MPLQYQAGSPSESPAHPSCYFLTPFRRMDQGKKKKKEDKPKLKLAKNMKLKGPSIKLIISKSKGQCSLEMEENHWQLMPTYMHVFCQGMLKTWSQICARCPHDVGRSSLRVFKFQIRKWRPGNVKKLNSGQVGEGGFTLSHQAPGPAVLYFVDLLLDTTGLPTSGTIWTGFYKHHICFQLKEREKYQGLPWDCFLSNNT